MIVTFIKVATRDAKKVIKTFPSLCCPVQNVMVDLAFTLGGSGLARLTTFAHLIETQNWQAAADGDCLDLVRCPGNRPLYRRFQYRGPGLRVPSETPVLPGQLHIHLLQRCVCIVQGPRSRVFLKLCRVSKKKCLVPPPPPSQSCSVVLVVSV